MVRRLTRDGDGVAVVVGAAGSGKTFALAAAREAWEASGTPVIGAAVARAGGMGIGGGRRHPVDEHPVAPRMERDRLSRRAVVVVDEAAMVGTRQLVDLSEAARMVRGRLGLVGDHRQLPAIEAGRRPAGILRARGLSENLDAPGGARLARYVRHE